MSENDDAKRQADDAQQRGDDVEQRAESNRSNPSRRTVLRGVAAGTAAGFAGLSSAERANIAQRTHRTTAMTGSSPTVSRGPVFDASGSPRSAVAVHVFEQFDQFAYLGRVEAELAAARSGQLVVELVAFADADALCVADYRVFVGVGVWFASHGKPGRNSTRWRFSPPARAGGSEISRPRWLPRSRRRRANRAPCRPRSSHGPRSTPRARPRCPAGRTEVYRRPERCHGGC